MSKPKTEKSLKRESEKSISKIETENSISTSSYNKDYKDEPYDKQEESGDTHYDKEVEGDIG